ncbi:MAG TPA: hypothetical protein VLA19_09945 [Herpetosiphonaceae bacterium]|nr:hypothetical protein [Herpetosiphonaceae bacterium]
MPKTTRRLVSVAVLILAVSLVGAVLAYIWGWQTQLGSDNPNITIGELAARGSVTSIPLAPLIALAIFALLARSRRWWGALAVVGRCLLAVVFFAASLAEVEALFIPSYPRAVLLTSVTVYILLALALLLSGILDLVDRVQTRRSVSARV